MFANKLAFQQMIRFAVVLGAYFLTVAVLCGCRLMMAAVLGF